MENYHMTKEEQFRQEERQLTNAMDKEAENKNKIITQEDILTYARVLNKVNNYDTILEALKDCYRVFEAEYEDLSNVGKAARLKVIEALQKSENLIKTT